MLKLINSIGQRKLSKILFFSSIFISLLCFTITSGAEAFTQPLTWLGVLLMSSPIGFLSWGAHRSKDYRMLCLVSQATLIIMNVGLYFMKVPDFFFVLTILENFATLGFSILFNKKQPVKVMVKRKRRTTTKAVTQSPETHDE